MHLHFIHVQQCIQISTRINSSMYIHTSVFVSFETSTTRPIFNTYDLKTGSASANLVNKAECIISCPGRNIDQYILILASLGTIHPTVKTLYFYSNTPGYPFVTASLTPTRTLNTLLYLLFDWYRASKIHEHRENCV